jgi:hypothetical protein
MQRLDQRQELKINVLSAMILKSHPKHMSSHLLFDNADTEMVSDVDTKHNATTITG